MNQNDYLRNCAIAMASAILLLTIFVSAWCLVSAILAVCIIAVTDYLSDEPLKNQD